MSKIIKRTRVNTPIIESYKSNAVRQVVQNIPNKATNDILRNLRNELDSYKNDNQDLREDKSALTQQYLYAKDQINELLHKLEAMKKQWEGQERLIQDKVQQGILVSQDKLQSTVMKQGELIIKLRREKVLLSKNTYDLQERLKDTRHELHLTQKQLYTCQTALIKTSNQGSNIELELNTANQGHRSNQIMNFNDQYQSDQQYNQNKVAENKQNHQIDNFTPNIKGPKTKSNRAALGVARSLALAKIPFNAPSESEKKYNWLFNDDETPRQQEKAEIRHDTNSKMLRQNKYLQQNEEDATAANSHFKPCAEQQQQENSCENLTDTIQSMRDNPDEVLLAKNPGQNAQGSAQVRGTLVGKSIQGVKNILKKAKETDFQGLMPRVSVSGAYRPNSRQIDHNNVEIEFGNGNNSRYEDNPLDDDSN